MLYLVATPIGNLGDLTHRAQEVLAQVDWIACEDTRKTSILLKHYQISKPMIAFNSFNEAKVLPKLLEHLTSGENLALVTDAGTPGISDPGYSLVHAAIERGLEFSALPGASASIMALTLSGLPAHSFTFRGFPPNRAGARRHFLQADAGSAYTLVYYESPYRLAAFLRDALEVFGDRQASVSNDLTKKFEKIYRGSLTELNQLFAGEPIRGEYVVCIAGLDVKAVKKPAD